MSNDADELEGFIRTAEAVRLMGLGTSQFYKCRKTDPDFPRPVHLGYRTVVYSRREVQLWIRAKLEAARQAATR
jgi:predicted DNA-binding transcriptional regulator AlpA